MGRERVASSNAPNSPKGLQHSVHRKQQRSAADGNCAAAHHLGGVQGRRHRLGGVEEGPL
jgi:hypothetical protein